MKKVLFMLLTTWIAMAMELPQSIQATVTTVGEKYIIVDKEVPPGMSGIVVHNYGNGISAITHTLTSQTKGQATLHLYTAIEHDQLPNIKSPATKGDKVIFGNFYDNVLLLAPNEKTYSHITASIKRNWIHPDVYAMYLIEKDEERISISNLRAFATMHQLGLVVIVTQSGLRVLDPFTGQYLAKLPYSVNSTGAMSPFYARFEQISDSFWGNEVKQNFETYYKGVENIR
ncbi:MAG TPA: hypothetical protein ENK86_04960 [Campylobacterales bacterium]|nr:hypothetical protein [Campylobacterales bacterium]